MAAVDLGQHGIRVNIIAAGWLSDERSKPILTEDGQLHTPEDIPLGTIGEPGDVGNLCCFLASPLSRYITGTVIPVDGGFLLTKSSAQTPYELNGGS
jgi:3-oxoacyl-[acyl-carrier protein] reductase